MQLLYTDETNLDPEHADFFAYGGISVDVTHTAALSADINALRGRYGYGRQDVLKFNTRERPNHITPAVHAQIKQAVMEAAAQHQVKFLASLILHQVATSPDDARRNEINRICYHFDCHLNRVGDVGLVLIDTFQDAQLTNILREKFQVGLRGMPYTHEMPLSRILGYHLATIGSSHFCSVIDIVLGAFRFVVNNRNDATKAGVVRELLAQMAPLFIRDDRARVSELSLFFSPKVIRAKRYREQYEALHRFFGDAGLTPYQAITGERNY
jgi:hypothetical protein